MIRTAATPSHAARAARGIRTGLLAAGAVLAVAMAGLMLLRPREELPVIAAVPPFRLTDQSGIPLALADLGGKPWVASFLYTTCPGPCPLVVQKLKALRRDVPAQDLSIVSISVDPQTDTPEVLGAWASKHGIDRAQGWYLLTGPTDEVLGLIRKGFLSSVGTAQEMLGPDAKPDELEAALQREGAVVHSIRLILVDGGGSIRGVYSSDDEQQLERLRGDVRRLKS